MYVHLFSLYTFAIPSLHFLPFLFLCMWQSCVKIEHYSIAYFDRITAFEEL